MVNLVHLKPKEIPVFPLDVVKDKGKNGSGGATKRRTKRKMKALVDAAQGMSIGQDAEGEGEDVEEVDDGNVYADDPDTDEGSSCDEGIDKTPVLNGREEVEPPGLEGWKMSIGGGDERRMPSLMNCALGMGGRVIVGVGSESSLWVWNLSPKKVD